MKKNIGLWIDHRKAVIVVVTGEEKEIKQINSNVEKQLRRADPSHSNTQYDPLQVPADDRQEREFTQHLSVYYDEVIDSIREAEAILIFGPGEAKQELKHQMKRDNLDGHIKGIETADKMTDPQIVTKVQGYFLKYHSVIP